MEDYVDKTIRAYDDVATYESSTSQMIPEVELNQFLNKIPPGAVILDAGCAYGRDTKYIHDKGFSVQGIDLSIPLINRAAELFPQINFQVCDVRHTPFKDNQFDGIWCNATLLHLNDQDMLIAVQELCRILKSRGVLVISLKKGSGTSEFVENFSSNSERFFNFKTHDTFLELLNKTGLKEIDWLYINEKQRYGEDKRDIDWLYSFSEKV